MSAIFDAFTEPPQGNTFRWGVSSLVGDIEEVSENPAFALQILMDAWEEGIRWGGTDLCTAETAAEFKELFEIFMGPKVPTDPDGFLLTEDGSVREPRIKAKEFYGDRATGGWGISAGQHYISLKGDPEEFKRRTAAIITDHKVLENGPEDAYFESTVIDARYLAHLVNPTDFQTAFAGLPYD